MAPLLAPLLQQPASSVRREELCGFSPLQAERGVTARGPPSGGRTGSDLVLSGLGWLQASGWTRGVSRGSGQCVCPDSTV